MVLNEIVSSPINNISVCTTPCLEGIAVTSQTTTVYLTMTTTVGTVQCVWEPTCWSLASLPAISTNVSLYDHMFMRFGRTKDKAAHQPGRSTPNCTLFSKKRRTIQMVYYKAKHTIVISISANKTRLNSPLGLNHQRSALYPPTKKPTKWIQKSKHTDFESQ